MNFPSYPFNPSIFLEKAKWAFSTRRTKKSDVTSLSADFSGAKAGDLLLAQVESIGSHKNIQLQSGRPSELFVGDLVVLACGSRYATDQFLGEAVISTNSADLLAGGGCAGQMLSKHQKLSLPTRLKPLGLLVGSDESVLNLSRYALSPVGKSNSLQVFCLVGSSMNSGKTTAAASLIHGLTLAGYRVGAIKLTGTGAFGDYNAYQDAGAHWVADLTDAGYCSTFGVGLESLENSFELLMGHALRQECDVAVIELADGLLQRETAALLRSRKFVRQVSGFVYTAGDPLAVLGGLNELGKVGIIPTAISGLVSCAPIAIAEIEEFSTIPVFTRENLRSAAGASTLINRVAFLTSVSVAA